MRKTPQMLELEVAHGVPIEQLIIERINKHNGITAAAESLGINEKTLWGWMTRLHIQLKRIAIAS